MVSSGVSSSKIVFAGSQYSSPMDHRVLPGSIILASIIFAPPNMTGGPIPLKGIIQNEASHVFERSSMTSFMGVSMNVSVKYFVLAAMF